MPEATGIRDALHNEVLRGINAPAYGATVYTSLFSVAPAIDGTGGTELTGSGYTRAACTFAAPTTVGAVRRVTNDTAATFPAASGAAWTPIYAGIYSASTAGVFLGGAAISVSGGAVTGQVSIGETLSFPIGSIAWDR